LDAILVMTWRVVLLAVATSVRLPSLAAVSALLVNPRPRRYLSAYVLAGAAFTITFGLLVVWLFHGVEVSPSSHRPRAIAELFLGVVFLGVAVVVATRHQTTPEARTPRKKTNPWIEKLNRHVTVAKAALAGPATHLPGLLYLIALNLVAASTLHARAVLFEVLLFNAIWFAVPIAGLVISLKSPQSATKAVETVERTLLQHWRIVAAVVCVAVGTALVIHGLQLL